MRVVIIGAGLGGLSAACHLAGAGHQVTVVEREALPGGRAGVARQNGFTFDTGPSVLTMPDILRAAFAATDTDMDTALDLQPVDPMYRATFPDQAPVHLRRGQQAMEAEIREVCGPGDAAQFSPFCEWLTELYRIEMPSFIDRNFDSMIDMVNPARPMVDLFRAGGMNKLINKVNGFFNDERLRRLFSFQALYAGMSPFDALAIYGVITYMDSVGGVYFPRGGMHEIPTTLAAAAEKVGTEFVYSTSVLQILRKTDGSVRGVGLDNGRSLQADVVVANPDLGVVYRDLLGTVKPPRVVTKGEYSPSCLVWHAGVKGDLPADAAHHNIAFGGQWDEAFEALIQTGRPMPDPSILITAPTKSDPSMAPAGCHNLFVLEPVPNLDGTIDWDREGAALRDRLRGRVESLGFPVEAVTELWVDPPAWKQMGHERGTPFSLSHKFLQTGPFRPNNIDKRIPGLVFVGSTTVPGVGVPMVLISGKLAAQRVQKIQDASGQ